MGVYQNIVFPSELLAKPGLDGYIDPAPVEIASSPDGKSEERNQTASEGRYVLVWPAQGRWHAERSAMYEFYMGVGGRRDSFLVLDPREYFNTVTGQALGLGDGATVDFQLVHAFGSYLHTVNKPVSGTVVVYIDDVAQPNRWSVDLLTGIVTFGADVVQTVTNAASSGANTVLTFSVNTLQVGDSVWLTGFTGPWAALNATRYPITARTSTTITLAHDASSYAAYSGNGGTTHTIPQATEVVSADCQHYYQVRFDSELRGPDVIVNQFVNLPGIRLVEVRE